MTPTMELAGAQGSYLEGEVFNQVLQRHGIAAVSALTQAQREGQLLTRVDGSNLDAVLAAIDLGGEIESRIRSAVGNAKIAWVPETAIDVNQWHGTGYVLEDPATGAAAYLLSGGYAGGSETGDLLEELEDILGSEGWLQSGPLEALKGKLLSLLQRSANPGGGGPDTNNSDPINLATGNLWFAETDLYIQARGLPIQWSRVYNSRSTRSGLLGYGWTFGYGEHLEEQTDGSVLYREADGTEHRFTPDGAGGYTRPPGKHLTLTVDGSGFVLDTPGGVVSHFTSDGRLSSITEPNGNTVSINYDTAGTPTTIADATGRTALTITTTGGKISQITDLAGRTVIYHYTGDDLTSVIDASGDPWTYSYDAEHNLIARTGPLGHTDSYAYDTLDRCFAHVDPLGHEETFSFESRGSRAVLTDRRGNDNYFEFDERGRAQLRVDPLGNAARSTWDADNNRVSTTDGLGGETTRTFDTQGNLLTETNPLGQSFSYTYDPVFNQVATMTDPTG
ncbi:MAG: RHS repeat protein, partial [bacterium]|nr:RHS repeat protein [bacterium]